MIRLRRLRRLGELRWGGYNADREAASKIFLRRRHGVEKGGPCSHCGVNVEAVIRGG